MPRMFTNPFASDPLGIKALVDADERRRRNFAETGDFRALWQQPFDPMWDSYLEANAQAGVDRMRDQSVGARRGQMGAGPGYTPTFNPAHQTTAVQQHRSINAPNMLQGLMNAFNQPAPRDEGGLGMPVEEGFWSGRRQSGRRDARGQQLLRVVGQRGGPRAE